jgi:hypothetical protein
MGTGRRYPPPRHMTQEAISGHVLVWAIDHPGRVVPGRSLQQKTAFAATFLPVGRESSESLEFGR